ncbi:MAG TPA: hypothetical protein VK153_01385 [Candidatus Paceibacterota bacterium]|nr:hypothetical protein [Candidatus Paceibacterota bacterium]
MIEENKNKIEDVKRTLYDPTDKNMSHKREGVLHQVNHNVSADWQNNQNPNTQNDNMKNKFKRPPMSVFKKFFVASFIFFVAAIGFAFYKFSYNDTSVSSEKINIQVIGNSFTKGGDELPLQIEITNNNNANLELANLIIEYPKGAEDNSVDVVRLPRDNIGTVKPNESVIRNIKVKLFGEEKSIRNIKVSLEYHPQGSNAIFTKDIFYPVTISVAPLSLDIKAPESAISNQPISFSVTATLNTSLSPSDNPILQLTYPNNFVFESATPSPTLGNSIWDLSKITATDPMSVEVKGRLMGQDGEEQVFHAYAGTTNGTNQSAVNVVYSSVLKKVLISKPFLDARILVGGQDKTEYVAQGGQTIDADIAWSNNLSTRITDGQIVVHLSGNVFDKTTVNPTSGFYDSVNSQIVWDKSAVPQLAEINPGESGTVSFSFKPVSLIGLSSVKNPQVNISVSIKGRQPQLGSTYSDIDNFSEKVVKILSDFQIASSASFSSGNMPPKAETETNYIVTWTLSNSANNITQAEARSVLPIYVKWVGVVNGVNDNLTYNDVTREVVWKIGQVAPNTGINTNREISFVVSLKPSLNQVGSVPQLMKEIYLSGMDSFTNTLVKSTRGPITTSISTNNGRVVQ